MLSHFDNFTGRQVPVLVFEERRQAAYSSVLMSASGTLLPCLHGNAQAAGKL